MNGTRDGRRGAPGSVVRAEPAQPEAIPALRHAAAEFAAAHGASAALVEDVALAVSEAATNAVKYSAAPADSRVVELGLSARDGLLEVRIADRGEGFGAGESDGLGLGLSIIARLADDLTIVQEGEGTEVRMRFALHREEH